MSSAADLAAIDGNPPNPATGSNGQRGRDDGCDGERHRQHHPGCRQHGHHHRQCAGADHRGHGRRQQHAHPQVGQPVHVAHEASEEIAVAERASARQQTLHPGDDGHS